MIRCLVIDDEPLALDILVKYIEKIPELELIACCTSAMEAMEIINNREVDLLFLDIQMSEITGIQLLKSLRKSPMVIFTTAYNEYALEGYELDIMDYLIKPIPFGRFLKAVNKVQEYFLLKKTSGLQETEVATPDFIFVKSEHQMIKINFDDILYIEGLKDYVKIICPTGRPILTLQNLKTIENKLPPKKFVRVHKSYIVSFDKITSVHKGRIKIANVEIPVGDSFRESFMKLIE